MVDIVFPTSTAPGARPGEGSGRLINCYAEALDNGARNQFVRRRSPGLKRLAFTTFTKCRGFHFHNGNLFVALDNRLVRVNYSGGVASVTDLGILPGTQRVTFARNNKAPIPDILVTTEDDTFIVNPSGSPVSLGEGDLPQAISIDFLDGYFVWGIRDGRFFVSGINDKTVSALDFGKAESHPGGIYRAVAFGELLYLCGPSSIEVWQNAGNATGSPFSRASVINRGVAGTYAIAGNEYGFPALIFVGDDNAVYRIDGGYQINRISTPDLDRLIEKVADKTAIDVTVGITEGHYWGTVTGPTFSWTYEVGTGFWHERVSYLNERWRGVCSTPAFGKWVIGDRETGDIWFLDADTHREGEDHLVMTATSLPAVGFLNRVAIPRADFDVIVGQGLIAGHEPIDTDPVCEVSWSDDGGNSFGVPLLRQLGRQAEHKTVVSVNRTGMASRYGRVWKFEVSDPVYVGLLGGSVDGEARSR
ncbi:hypothetical protein MRBLRH13_000252 [Agrobacterium radiobacter]|uniref:packaged DNA stabilization protein n=1 Tax=Agrobacterium radiobacter TaxID=362 RepID=UPI0034185252